MRLEPERALVVAHARRLGPDGLAVGTAGNISVRAGDVVAVTPSGVGYEGLTAADVCLVDVADGRMLEGERAPSSELPLHLAVYAATGAGAVVHTHAPYATALSTVVGELPAVHYLIADLGGPVRVAPYAPPGSDELAGAVAAALSDRSAALLGNHGTVTIAGFLERAYARSVLLEWLAALYHRARALGEPRVVPPEELARVAGFLEGYLPGR